MTPPKVLGTPKPASSVMISSTLGAPLGGTTRGAHQAFDCRALSLITPPNFGSGAGSCAGLTVVVALGEPSVPVTCWARALGTAAVVARDAASSSEVFNEIMCGSPEKQEGPAAPRRAARRPGLEVDRTRPELRPPSNKCESPSVAFGRLDSLGHGCDGRRGQAST